MSAPNIYEVIYGCFVVLWFGIVHKMCNIGSEMLWICEWAVIFHIYGRMLINIIEIFRKLDEKIKTLVLFIINQQMAPKENRSDKKSFNKISSMFNKIFLLS